MKRILVVLLTLTGCDLYAAAGVPDSPDPLHWPKRPTHPGPCDPPTTTMRAK